MSLTINEAQIIFGNAASERVLESAQDFISEDSARWIARSLGATSTVSLERGGEPLVIVFSDSNHTPALLITKLFYELSGLSGQ